MKNKKLIVHIDLDDTFVHFSRAQQKALEKNPGIKYPQSQHNFFRELIAKPYAMYTYHALIKDPRYEVWILTAPSIKNRLCYTEKADWVEAWLGEDQLNRFIICPDKTMVKGDILIDDKVWEGFEGRQLVFGSTQFPDWADIYYELIEKDGE